jgi:protein O-mannosyl-transferase
MAALSPRSVPWLAALFVVGCTLAAFLNSLDGEFLMDDYCEILDNPLMASPWPPWRVMLVGHELPSRPLPYLTFAIDHAIWGKRAFGYHLTNLAIHIVAALALFFLARTTLLSPRLREAFGGHADVLAASIAALWAAHPLHTQAVTYIYQRLESMTGMLCLVSLAAFAGAVARQWNTRWLAASVVASAAAMFSKETAVVLPLLIASYDWLLCGEPPPPAGRRIRFYTALCTTWGLLGLQMVVQARRYDATGAFTGSPIRYFLTQPRVILHYLRLAFWPTGLCFDFNFPILATWSQIVPSLVYMVAFGTAMLLGLVRRRPWAWPGVAFLLALAPSSSFLPLAAVSEEYRMYLALAAVASAVVLAGYTLTRRWSPPDKARTMAFGGAAALTLAAVLILVILTQERNRVYATPGGVWLDVLEKGRAGTRAYWNLAMACDEHDAFDAAIEYADEVVARNPSMDVYDDLVESRLRKGDAASAETYLRHAVETQADHINRGQPLAVRNLAHLVLVLAMQGKSAEAQPLAAKHLERVQATLGDNHPWTRELMAIRDGAAAEADGGIGGER